MDYLIYCTSLHLTSIQNKLLIVISFAALQLQDDPESIVQTMQQEQVYILDIISCHEQTSSLKSP